MNLKDFKKGPKGLKYKAYILPSEIHAGGTSLLMFEFYNTAKEALDPQVYIKEALKKGLIGKKTIKPKTTTKDSLYFPGSGFIIELEPNDYGFIGIPVFSTPMTPKGEYEIRFSLNVNESTAARIAKTTAKIAMALTIGSFSKVRYFKLKVKEPRTSETKSESTAILTKILDYEVSPQPPFYPGHFNGVGVYQHNFIYTLDEENVIIIKTLKYKTEDMEKKINDHFLKLMDISVEESGIEKTEIKGVKFYKKEYLENDTGKKIIDIAGVFPSSKLGLGIRGSIDPNYEEAFYNTINSINPV